MNKEQMIQIFKEREAIKEGHFLLTSGRHSDRYMQCALVLQDPQLAQDLCEKLLQKMPPLEIDLVIGPALGGVTMAYEMGRQLKKRALFAERENGQMTLRRGFSIKPGEKVLVTEDVITTGGSVKEVIKIVEGLGGQVLGVACLVDRSDGQADLGYPLYSLLSLAVQSYEAAQCPLCEKGLPLVKPGSRANKV